MDLGLMVSERPALRSPEKSESYIGYSSEEDGRERGMSPQRRSRRKRKNSDSPLLPEGYVNTWRPRKFRRLRVPLYDYIRSHSNTSRRLQSQRENPVMLSVDGIQVKLHICAGIAAERGQVFDEYVRAAGKLYERVWAARYADRSKRFMLDPWFAMCVFKKRDKEIDTRVFTPQMDGVSPQRINVVFVPVLFEGHWWCVAFSMNREEILVIDSIQTSSAVEVHSANVDHLAYAMDLVFKSLDPNWEIGTVTTWRRTSLHMAQQGDLHNCGVHMLAAIKRNAERLLTDVKLEDDINFQRSWLLWEDLMSEYNEVRSDVVKLILPAAHD